MTMNLFSIGSTPVKSPAGAMTEESTGSAIGIPEADASSQSLFLPMFMQMLFAQNMPAVQNQAVMGEVTIPIEQLEIVDSAAEGIEGGVITAVNVSELTQLSVEKTQTPVTTLQAELSKRNAQLQLKDDAVDTLSMETKGRLMFASAGQPSTPAPAVKQEAAVLRNVLSDENAVKLNPTIKASVPSVTETTSSPKPSAAPEYRKPAAFSSVEQNDAEKVMTAVKTAGSMILPVDGIKTPIVDEQHVAVDPVANALQKPQTEKTEKPIDKRNGKSGPASEREGVTPDLLKEVEEYTVVASKQSSRDMTEEHSQQPFRQSSEQVGAPVVKTDLNETMRPTEEINAISFKATVEAKSSVHTVTPVTAPLKPETVQSVLEQITKGVAVAVDEQRSEMKMILHPESLGEVRVRVHVEEGKVSTTMDVQHIQVKNAIESGIPQLREALSGKGLTMERIEITTAQNGLADGTAKNHHSNDRQKSHRTLQLDDEENEAVKLLGYNTVEYII